MKRSKIGVNKLTMGNMHSYTRPSKHTMVASNKDVFRFVIETSLGRKNIYCRLNVTTHGEFAIKYYGTYILQTYAYPLFSY
jgi:hypothetical protein